MSGVESALKDAFSPEFRNRIDSVIQFSGLSKASIRLVAEKFIDELSYKLMQQKVSLEVSNAAIQFLMNKGYDPAMGARPMKRVVTELVKKPLSGELLFGKLQKGGIAKIDLDGDQLDFTFIKGSVKSSGLDKPKKTAKNTV